MIRSNGRLLIGMFALLLLSCVASKARQALNAVAPIVAPPAAASAPAGKSLSSVQAAQQSGQGNVSGQIEAQGWTGIEYTTALPLGQVSLMAIMLWLSHRREMERIKQNGKYLGQVAGGQ